MLLQYIYIFLFTACAIPSYALTFIVDSNGDNDNLSTYTFGDGTNTLRKCLRLANTNPGLDIINFNITGSTLITNTVAGGGAWLSVSDPVVIDGYTQPGASAGNPTIELDGALNGRWFGVQLGSGSAGSTIKGLIIYGTNIGVRLSPNTSNNTIAGCWIGTDNTGNAAAPNPIPEHGIRIERSSNNVFGGSGGAIDRNIVAACAQEGIRFEGTSSDNTIKGNYLGIGNDGITNLGLRNAIFADNTTKLTVGGTNINEHNIISGNTQRAIFMINCDSFVIIGNTIGLAADILSPVPNSLSSVEAISGSDAGRIGGAGAHERNYISGNNSSAIRIDDCNNTIIQGNYIGVAADGFTSRPNAGNGIIGINCEFTTVGGVAPGEGNVISSNGAHGVSIFGGDSRNTVVQGNKIGVSANGTIALGNGVHGIELNENEDSQIGGSTPLAQNIVANNTANGIVVNNSPRTAIEGNFIGVDGTGLVDMGNRQHGILIINSADVFIGGASISRRNVIGGNNLSGVSFEGTSPNGIVKANFIGVGADGSTVIKNDFHGVSNQGASHNMTVGGPTLAERNVISGNGTFVVDTDPDNGIIGDGIRILGSDNHLIQNNYLGTDSTGTIGIGNHWGGVSINNDSDNNDILDNLISDNRNEGIWIFDGSDNNRVFRNIVGESSSGAPLGNWDYGVVINNGASNSNIIGGSLANANIIAHTRGERPGLDGDGVTVAAGAGNNNEITFNNIHCNAGKGIFRQGAANESQAAPIIIASNTNGINGTGDNGRLVHIYANISSDGGLACDCEGESYIGSTTVVGGIWSLTHNLNLGSNSSSALSATQTTSTGSSSEFSVCTPPSLLPIELVFFNGMLNTSGNVDLFWATNIEINNEHFIIERSTSENAQDWEAIGLVNGAGNSSSELRYTFEDPTFGLNERGCYYRLKQVDFDGTTFISNVIYVELNAKNYSGIHLYPNPSTDYIHVTGVDFEGMDFSIVDVLGINVHQQVHIKQSNAQHLLIDIANLPSGVYYFILNSGEFKETFIKQ